MVNHMRHTRGHTRNRRSHDAISSADVKLCSNCGNPSLKHVACKNCGFYKGRDVLNLKAKLDKKAEKSKPAEKVVAKKPAKKAKVAKKK